MYYMILNCAEFTTLEQLRFGPHVPNLVVPITDVSGRNLSSNVHVGFAIFVFLVAAGTYPCVSQNPFQTRGKLEPYNDLPRHNFFSICKFRALYNLYNFI